MIKKLAIVLALVFCTSMIGLPVVGLLGALVYLYIQRKKERKAQQR